MTEENNAKPAQETNGKPREETPEEIYARTTKADWAHNVIDHNRPAPPMRPTQYEDGGAHARALQPGAVKRTPGEWLKSLNQPGKNGEIER